MTGVWFKVEVWEHDINFFFFLYIKTKKKSGTHHCDSKQEALDNRFQSLSITQMVKQLQSQHSNNQTVKIIL